uniref:Uncharacterized protein n=1 Tax=Acrobeloides nanus TaxID=290746 RepID=A0A914DLT7_9BILA
MADFITANVIVLPRLRISGYMQLTNGDCLYAVNGFNEEITSLSSFHREVYFSTIEISSSTGIVRFSQGISSAVVIISRVPIFIYNLVF